MMQAISTSGLGILSRAGAMNVKQVEMYVEVVKALGNRTYDFNSLSQRFLRCFDVCGPVESRETLNSIDMSVHSCQ